MIESRRILNKMTSFIINYLLRTPLILWSIHLGRTTFEKLWLCFDLEQSSFYF